MLFHIISGLGKNIFQNLQFVQSTIRRLPGLFVQAVLKKIMSSKAVLSTNLNQRLLPSTSKHGLSLKEARQETRLSGFQQIRLSQHISTNTPCITSCSTFPSTTSYPSSIHTSSSLTPLVPSSSKIISSTAITLSSSPSLAS